MGTIKDKLFVLSLPLQNFLNRKGIGYVIIFLLFAIRTVQLLFLFSTRNDMTFQILAAQNLDQGHGLSIGHIDAGNLSMVHYAPLQAWPPGYSLIFLAFYKLCFSNYLTAAILLQLVSAFALVLACRKILALFSMPAFRLNLYLLATGFCLFYFYAKPCTDAIAITCLNWAAYFMLLLFKTNHNNIRNTILASLLLTAAALIKYLYLPVVFTFPCAMITYGLYAHRHYLCTSGLMIITILLIVITGYFIYQNTQSGTIGYIKQPERGFFPNNLLAFHPFIPAAFLKPESLQILLGLNQPAMNLVMILYRVIHIAGLIVLLIGFIRIAQYAEKADMVMSYHTLTFLMTLAIVGLLAFLSLRVAPEATEIGPWTYVEEPRYYGAIHIMLLLGLFIGLEQKSKQWRILLIAGVIFLLPELFRGLIFTANRVRNLAHEKYGWQQELSFQQYVDGLIREQKKHHPDASVVLAGDSDWMNLRAALYTHHPVFEDGPRINDLAQLGATSPVLLFVQIRNKHLADFSGFIHAREVKFLASRYEFSFYTVYIRPQ